MSPPSEKYLDDWNTRVAQAIFESDMAHWIERELGGFGLPDNWEVD